MGEILREEYLVPLGMTQEELAGRLGCEVEAVGRMVDGSSPVSPEMASKLAAAFDTSPDF